MANLSCQVRSFDDVFAFFPAPVDEVEDANSGISCMVVLCQLDTESLAMKEVMFELVEHELANCTLVPIFAEKTALVLDVAAVPADGEDTRPSTRERSKLFGWRHHNDKNVSSWVCGRRLRLELEQECDRTPAQRSLFSPGCNKTTVLILAQDAGLQMGEECTKRRGFHGSLISSPSLTCSQTLSLVILKNQPRQASRSCGRYLDL